MLTDLIKDKIEKLTEIPDDFLIEITPDNLTPDEVEHMRGYWIVLECNNYNSPKLNDYKNPEFSQLFDTYKNEIEKNNPPIKTDTAWQVINVDDYLLQHKVLELAGENLIKDIIFGDIKVPDKFLPLCVMRYLLHYKKLTLNRDGGAWVKFCNCYNKVFNRIIGEPQ
jgi:hypothetical protein